MNYQSESVYLRVMGSCRTGYSAFAVILQLYQNLLVVKNDSCLEDRNEIADMLPIFCSISPDTIGSQLGFLIEGFFMVKSLSDPILLRRRRCA